MKETKVCLIQKGLIASLKEDKTFIEYISNELTKEISERLIRFLEENYEIIPKNPAVRCKDCKWYDLTDPCGTLTPNSHRCKRVTRLWMEDDAYCSYGERREDEKSTKRTD